MYRAINLANYILKKCIDDKHPISNVQLQKILYYLQRESLRRYGCPLFADVIEAWGFGPCIPNVYYRWCASGVMRITLPFVEEYTPKAKDIPFINEIIEKYRDKLPWEMSEFLPETDSAWAKIWDHTEGNKKEIPWDLIREAG